MATRRPCGVCGNTYAENKDGALRKHKCVDALIDVPAVPAAAPDAAAEDAARPWRPALAPGFGMLNAKLERLADAALAAERAEQPPPPPPAKRCPRAAGEEAWLAAVADLSAESPTYPRRRETFGAYGSRPSTRAAVAGANPAFYDSLEAALEAADHGDVVLLGPGTGRSSRGATEERDAGRATAALRKSVEILGAGRPRVSVVAEAPFHVLEAPLVVSQAHRGAGAVLRRTVVYCGPRTASAAVHVAHADAGPVFLANADLRCDAGLTDALGVGVLVVGVATSLIRGADRGVHADREAPAAFRRDVALEGGTVVLACSPSVKHAALAAAAYAKKSKQPKRPWDFGRYDLTRLLILGHAGTSVFRRVPKDVLALVASYVAADRILDMVPNLRTQAKRRYEATKRTLESARNAAARAAALVEAARAPGRVLDDAEKCRSLLVQVPGAADELANDLELRKRYGGLRAGVQHRDATDYGVDDDVAADDYAVTVPAPPSYARRCADHGKRFARSSSAAMTLGVCTQGADPNESRVALCVAGRLRKAVTLVYNPRGEHFEPRVKFGKGLPRRDQAAGFWSGGPCPTCRRATSVVVDEAQVSAAIWACLPARFRDWAERDRLCLSLCDRGHLSGQLLAGGYAGCECCGGYGDMDY
ncbi:hypothetical protein SO694_001090101 [Aureococcus anophagefferens]|uniref:Uncharacterized protein n=1 Tax=Aureococcus anophagefferens TaxID=44056 RepID=A0ABR1FM36_AURAN